MGAREGPSWSAELKPSSHFSPAREAGGPTLVCLHASKARSTCSVVPHSSLGPRLSLYFSSHGRGGRGGVGGQPGTRATYYSPYFPSPAAPGGGRLCLRRSILLELSTMFLRLHSPTFVMRGSWVAAVVRLSRGAEGVGWMECAWYICFGAALGGFGWCGVETDPSNLGERERLASEKGAKILN